MPSHSAHKARLHQARIISVLDNFEPRLDLLTAHRAVMGGCGASEARLEVSARNQGSVRIGIRAYYACFGIAGCAALASKLIGIAFVCVPASLMVDLIGGSDGIRRRRSRRGDLSSLMQ